MRFFLIREDVKIHTLMKQALCCVQFDHNRRELLPFWVCSSVAGRWGVCEKGKDKISHPR